MDSLRRLASQFTFLFIPALSACSSGDETPLVNIETGDDNGEQGTGGDDDGGAEDPSGTSGGDDSTGGDGSTGGPEYRNLALGAVDTPLCDAAVAAYDAMLVESTSETPDPMTLLELYQSTGSVETSLQSYIRALDEAFDIDNANDSTSAADELIVSTLSNAGITEPFPEAFATVDATLIAHFNAGLRGFINAVDEAQPDASRDSIELYAQWHEAYCIWTGIIKPSATIADVIGTANGEPESIISDIEGWFELGNEAIEGPEVSWASDEFGMGPAKQVIEKSTFRMFDRLVVDLANQIQTAAVNEDPSAIPLMRRALGLMKGVRDRFSTYEDGYTTITEILAGDDATLVTPDDVNRAFSIVWAKRTRRYTEPTEEILVPQTAGGLTNAWEGRTYAKTILPRMADADPEFDMAAHLALWDLLVAAVDTGGESDDLMTASIAITADICEYHAWLEIADPDDPATCNNEDYIP